MQLSGATTYENVGGALRAAILLQDKSSGSPLGQRLPHSSSYFHRSLAVLFL